MVEQVQIQSEETTSEKPEVVEAPQENPETRPDWLPEKFSSAEDLAKAYSELESKQSQETKSDEPKQEPIKPDSLEIETAEEAVENAGLNMEALQSEYNETGTLTDKSYEALEKAGVSKDYVNAFIAGQEAIAGNIARDVRSTVGGDEQYSDMVNWAKNSLEPNEVAAYNNAVNSGDIETVKLAVGGLKARFDASNGSEPNLLTGKTAANVADGYQSWAQVTAAMNDARYSNDPAYRDSVQQKLAVSNL